MIHLYLDIYILVYDLEVECKNVLRKMRMGKLVGPDDIPFDVWNCVRQRELYGH